MTLSCQKCAYAVNHRAKCDRVKHLNGYISGKNSGKTCLALKKWMDAVALWLQYIPIT